MKFKNSNDYINMQSMRKEHSDGEHLVGCLVATIGFNSNLQFPEASKELEYVLNQLNQLPVRPHQLFVESGSSWEAVWYANDYQMVSDKWEYAGLILDFSEFLEQHQAPFFTTFLQDWFLLADSGERISELPNEAINFSPAFNVAWFGNDGEIEVIG